MLALVVHSEEAHLAGHSSARLLLPGLLVAFIGGLIHDKIAVGHGQGVIDEGSDMWRGERQIVVGLRVGKGSCSPEAPLASAPGLITSHLHFEVPTSIATPFPCAVLRSVL
jgi:hypothetical protein